MERGGITLDYVLWTLCGPPSEGCCGFHPDSIKRFNLRMIKVLTSSSETMNNTTKASAEQKRQFVRDNKHRWKTKAEIKKEIEERKAKELGK